MNTTGKLLVALLGTALAGCSSGQKQLDSEQVLPFTVRMTEVQFRETLVDEEDEELSTPALFEDRRQFTRKLASALQASGVFSRVVTESDVDVEADLELGVSISGDDFGPGTPTVTGATFSTITWLLIGIPSWFIDDRSYPDSDVTMNVTIRTPPPPDSPSPSGSDSLADSPEERTLFRDDLHLKGMELSFSERISTVESLLSLLIPPCLGDGATEITGSNLAGKSVSFFASQEPDRIASQLPAIYFKERSSFLAYDFQEHRLIVVSRKGLLELAIINSKGVRRVLNQDELNRMETQDEREKEAAGFLFSERVSGIGTSVYNWYYLVPLYDDEVSYIRVEAVLDGEDERARWTVWAPPFQ